MKMLKAVRVFAAISALLLAFPSAKAVAAIVSIGSAGSGTFVVQGSGFADVSGVDIAISYDTSTLSAPRVSQGSFVSGALFVSNINVPGSIRIAAVRTQPISGSGPIATISFTRTGSSPGRILSMNVSLANSSGASIPVQVLITNPTDTTSTSGSPEREGQTSTTGSTSTSAAATSSSTGSRYLGPSTITIPGQEAVTEAQQPTMETSPEPVETEAKETTTGEVQPEISPQQQASPESRAAFQPGKSTMRAVAVLDLFREYQSEKNPRALVALFHSVSTPGFRQEPSIALSDGVSRVKVFIKMQTGYAAPKFSLKGARLVSLKISGDEWLMELVPDRNVIAASVSVLDTGVTAEIPLTVVPPMDSHRFKACVSGEKEFDLFLEGKGAKRTPRFDLNNDRKRDYIDEYIFTGNYILRRGAVQNSKPGAI